MAADTTNIYTLSLHDALPILRQLLRARRRDAQGVRQMARAPGCRRLSPRACRGRRGMLEETAFEDRKSTRLNSSHSQISYAVFCLKKKKKIHKARNFNKCLIQ